MTELIGIENRGDFFAQHYFDALLAGELDELLARFRKAERDQKVSTPWRRLDALAERFFRVRQDAAGHADPERRLDAARGFHAAFLEALGYARDPSITTLPDGTAVPLLLELTRHHEPFLWIVEAPAPSSDDEAAPLEAQPLPSQLPLGVDASLTSLTWAELLDGPLLRQEHPPRYVLLLAGGEALLVDRHKWPQGRSLRFDLGVLYARRERAAFEALTGLLHREALAPDAGQSPLLERLDESSHKHAFAVTTDLGRGVREALEILANEALHYRRETQKRGVFDEPELAERLTHECITYLYRLLFLFYVEARSRELGVVPMNADAYRLGYALEQLRDFETAALESVESREGFFLDTSLKKLFRIVQHGYPRKQRTIGTDALSGGFVVEPLRARLFDDEQTPILASVKLRNHALRDVIERLSLSRPGKKGRGRISYAQLGINQLGAVYERLLSYRGFFATEDVLELRADATTQKEDVQTYFLPVSRRDEVDPELLVQDDADRALVHRKGTFLYRMAGRDREKSASYYTPEVLTRCVVKYTLLERLGRPFGPNDERPAERRLPPLKADEILELTLCEPAMGSGAFLVEAIDQLADHYLETKQRELGVTIPAEDYPREKAKVKHHFAANRCYGVDLNPLAAELGKVSLWLGSLYEGARAPFLDLRIVAGNSLVGARRAVFEEADLQRKASKKTTNWQSLVPRAVPYGTDRGTGLWHFLVADAGMAAAADEKNLKALDPEGTKKLQAWRKAFLAPYDAVEVRRLRGVAARVDALFAQALEARRAIVARCERRLVLFGREAVESVDDALPSDAQTLAEEVRENRRRYVAQDRLRRVMDYWCALFFWPVSAADALPSREDWLRDLEALTDLGAAGDGVVEGWSAGLDARLRVVDGISERFRFFHWELAFAEVFAGRGGMDVILGNPPWRKVEWKEGDVLADFEPTLAVGKLSASAWGKVKAGLLGDARARGVYFAEAEEAAGVQGFLNAPGLFPLLRGVKTNLYKAFLVRAIELGGHQGVAAMIHQKGLYDDPSGGELRAALAIRSSLHLHFVNKLKLFQEIKDEKHFEVSCFRSQAADTVDFASVSNLLRPSTLDESLRHDGHGTVPGIKDEQGRWDIAGHRSRLVWINAKSLNLFARLFDEPNTPPLEARHAIVHSREILRVLERFADAPKLGPNGDRWQTTREWNEGDRTADGTIRRETVRPERLDDVVFQGPHFYVGTPFNKEPNEGCRHNNDYSAIELETLADEFVPRSNYVPMEDAAEYASRRPAWNGRPIFEHWRHVHREMAPPTGERTLASALLPPGPPAVHAAFTMAFADLEDLIEFHAFALSIPADFYVKSTGTSHLNVDVVSRFIARPWPPELRHRAVVRALRLNCLTSHYAPLWEALWEEAFREDRPATDDPRAGTYENLGPKWTRDVAFRSPFARRQALVELDVLAAQALGLSFEELRLLYEVQFPVLQQYERETFYDQRGRIVFTVNKGLPGVGLDRKQWEEIRDARAGDVLPEWARDGVGVFVPPFDVRDRVEEWRGR
jgi:hypothetical protein